jgi:hypothetical protein
MIKGTKKRQVLLFAAHSAWGAASNFNEMFNDSGKYSAYEVLETDDIYGFGSKMKDRKIFYHKDKERLASLLCDKNTVIFAFDIKGLELLKRCAKYAGVNIKDYPVNIFWTGSGYVKLHRKYNIEAANIGATQYSMLDLLRFNSSSIPLMQPYDIRKGPFNSFPEKGLSGDIIICHSPGYKALKGAKGSSEISKLINKAKLIWPNIKYNQIGKASAGHSVVSNEVCLQQKADAHIFVDKYGAKTAGGIGKSGIEGLCLGVPTISAMHHSILRYPYDNIFIYSPKNETEFLSYLKDLLENEGAYNFAAKKTLESSLALGYEYTLKHLEQTMKR